MTDALGVFDARIVNVPVIVVRIVKEGAGDIVAVLLFVIDAVEVVEVDWLRVLFTVAVELVLDVIVLELLVDLVLVFELNGVKLTNKLRDIEGEPLGVFEVGGERDRVDDTVVVFDIACDLDIVGLTVDVLDVLIELVVVFDKVDVFVELVLDVIVLDSIGESDIKGDVDEVFESIAVGVSKNVGTIVYVKIGLNVGKELIREL